MKQSLQLKMGQHLTMTPQLQQAIKLLQLSTLDLQQEIQELIDTNPMLEIPDDTSTETEASVSNDDHADNANESQSNAEHSESASSELESTLNSQTSEANASDSANDEIDQDWQTTIPEDLPVDSNWDDVYQSSAPPSTSSSSSQDFSDNSQFENREEDNDSLYEHLHWQLNLTPMSDKDRLIATTLIDAIEPSGLLGTSVEELLEHFDESLEIELDEIEAVRHRIQQFDPLGVASLDLSDCLLTQLAQIPKDTPFREQAAIIIHRHLSILATRDYKQLMRRTRLNEKDLKSVIELIKSLNPTPGAAYAKNSAQYVIPDVFVKKMNDRWVVELNPDIAPKLRINSEYASMVKRADNSADNTYLKDNLQEAKWFLKSLHSRNETLLKVATRIVEHQRGFLDHGEVAMKPLVLHDIANDVDMHESTISRVTTQKFMHTPRGIFELKYFFSSHVSTATGGECSSTAIRAIIKQLVSEENTKKPLSDNKIAALLGEQGINVARRTIAKYRESLSIPPSNERKRLI